MAAAVDIDYCVILLDKLLDPGLPPQQVVHVLKDLMSNIHDKEMKDLATKILNSRDNPAEVAALMAKFRGFKSKQNGDSHPSLGSREPEFYRNFLTKVTDPSLPDSESKPLLIQMNELMQELDEDRKSMVVNIMNCADPEQKPRMIERFCSMMRRAPEVVVEKQPAAAAREEEKENTLLDPEILKADNRTLIERLVDERLTREQRTQVYERLMEPDVDADHKNLAIKLVQTNKKKLRHQMMLEFDRDQEAKKKREEAEKRKREEERRQAQAKVKAQKQKIREEKMLKEERKKRRELFLKMRAQNRASGALGIGLSEEQREEERRREREKVREEMKKFKENRLHREKFGEPSIRKSVDDEAAGGHETFPRSGWLVYGHLKPDSVKMLVGINLVSVMAQPDRLKLSDSALQAVKNAYQKLCQNAPGGGSAAKAESKPEGEVKKEDPAEASVKAEAKPEQSLVDPAKKDAEFKEKLANYLNTLKSDEATGAEKLNILTEVVSYGKAKHLRKLLLKIRPLMEKVKPGEGGVEMDKLLGLLDEEEKKYEEKLQKEKEEKEKIEAERKLKEEVQKEKEEKEKIEAEKKLKEEVQKETEEKVKSEKSQEPKVKGEREEKKKVIDENGKQTSSEEETLNSATKFNYGGPVVKLKNVKGSEFHPATVKRKRSSDDKKQSRSDSTDSAKGEAKSKDSKKSSKDKTSEPGDAKPPYDERRVVWRDGRQEKSVERLRAELKLKRLDAYPKVKNKRKMYRVLLKFQQQLQAAAPAANKAPNGPQAAATKQGGGAGTAGKEKPPAPNLTSEEGGKRSRSGSQSDESRPASKRMRGESEPSSDKAVKEEKSKAVTTIDAAPCDRTSQVVSRSRSSSRSRSPSKSSLRSNSRSSVRSRSNSRSSVRSRSNSRSSVRSRSNSRSSVRSKSSVKSRSNSRSSVRSRSNSRSSVRSRSNSRSSVRSRSNSRSSRPKSRSRSR